MRIVPLGEAAFIVRDLPGEAYRVAEALAALGLPGLLEVAPAWDMVGLYVDPAVFSVASLPSSLELAPVGERALHVFPVRFDGPDLAETASLVGLSSEELVRVFCEPTYTCRAVGFQPGFPYLEGLPDLLKPLGRLASPRVRVPAGSVAFAAGQAGIYPAESPGGWRLLGTMDLPLRLGPTEFRVAPGDRVRFHAQS